MAESEALAEPEGLAELETLAVPRAWLRAAELGVLFELVGWTVLNDPVRLEASVELNSPVMPGV